MVYESRVGETFLLGATHLAHRGHHLRAGGGHARRRASPARCRSGTATGRAGPSSWAGRSAPSSASCAAAPRGGHRASSSRAASTPRGRGQPRRATSTSRPRPPGSCPTTAPWWSSASATRSATGGSACSRPSAPRCTPRGRMALQARLAERWGLDVEIMWSDDGIVLRLPEAVDELPLDALLIDPDEIDELVVAQLPPDGHVRLALPGVRGPGPAAAPPPARSPHRRCGSSASGRPTCWRWRRSTPSSRSCSRPPASASTTCSTCRRCARCSPTCGRGGCGWWRSTPRRPRRSPSRCCSAGSPSTCTRATRRWPSGGPRPWPSTATCCATCSGAEELRELLDPVVLARPRARAAAPGRRPPGPRRRRAARPAAPVGAAVAPRGRGPLRPRRAAGAVEGWIDQLVGQRRAIEVVGRRRAPAGRRRGRRPPARRARGGACPSGSPPRSPSRSPSRSSTSWPATPAPTGRSSTASVARRFGVGADRVGAALDQLERQGRVVRGEFRPDGVEREWCDADVLRQLRRRSLAALRREVEPVDGAALARFLPAWQGVGSPRRGIDALVEAHRLAPGRGAGGVGARARRAGRPGRGLPAGRPRRAVHRGRGGVGRRRCGGRQRRPGPAAVPRPGRPAGARARRAPGPLAPPAGTTAPATA